MNEKWQEIYTRLERDLNSILHSFLPDMEKTEACYKCCLSYWEQVKQVIREHAFTGDRDEIRFFKYIKPQFTGQLEYYTLIYQYQLFCPFGETAAIRAFRQRERAKIAQSREEQARFIAYYASGATDRDAIFFLRKNNTTEAEEKSSRYVGFYDRDPDLVASYDWILTMFVGLGLYEKYLDLLDGKPVL